MGVRIASYTYGWDKHACPTPLPSFRVIPPVSPKEFFLSPVKKINSDQKNKGRQAGARVYE
jgi:hypothetical protein